MRSRAARLAVVTLLVVWSVGALGAVPGTADAATEQGVLLSVNIQESGDAMWTVTATYRLSTANDTEAFERVIDDYVNGEDVGPAVDPFVALANRAENRTGRSMTIAAVNRSGDIYNRSNVGSDTPGHATGELVLEFQWQNFADTTGEGIEVGDVFAGNWDLNADQTLVIRPPSGYSVDTVRPSTAVDGGVLRWEGPQNFGETEPAVVYLPSNSGPPGNGQNLIVIVGYIVGVGVALFGGGLAVYAWLRRDDFFDDGTAPPPQQESGATTESPDPDSSVITGQPETEVGVDEETDAPAEEVDPSLLSDEERVEQLLEANDGRMKQADIVTETDWSNAKVSQLLTSMADEGRVEKLRIGRENLITIVDDGEDEA